METKRCGMRFGCQVGGRQYLSKSFRGRAENNNLIHANSTFSGIGAEQSEEVEKTLLAKRKHDSIQNNGQNESRETIDTKLHKLKRHKNNWRCRKAVINPLHIDLLLGL